MEYNDNFDKVMILSYSGLSVLDIYTKEFSSKNIKKGYGKTYFGKLENKNKVDKDDMNEESKEKDFSNPVENICEFLSEKLYENKISFFFISDFVKTKKNKQSRIKLLRIFTVDAKDKLSIIHSQLIL